MMRDLAVEQYLTWKDPCSSNHFRTLHVTPLEPNQNATTNYNHHCTGTYIIVQNDHKPLAQFLNGKNTNNKVNRWSLVLVTYNITFEWISGAKNKAAYCLSRLVSPTGKSIIMLTASINNGPAFHTRSHTQSTSDPTSTPPVMPQLHISQDDTPMPKLLAAD